MLYSTAISLFFKLVRLGKVSQTQRGIKLHTLLEYDGCLPVYINLTDGKVNDAKAAKEIVLPVDSVVVADRAYVDFENLYRWHTGKSFFVVRLKISVKFNRLNEKELPDNRHQNILVDEYIELSEEKTKTKYPKKLRRVVVWYEVNHQTIELITNQFYWTASTITDLTKPAGRLNSFSKTLNNF